MSFISHMPSDPAAALAASHSPREASPTPKSVLQLPVELWLLIVRAIVNQDTRAGRWQDLLHLSWTCRIAHAVAQPFIWHTLTLVFGSEHSPARSKPSGSSCAFSAPHIQKHPDKSRSPPLTTVVIDPSCAFLGSVCKLPHLPLNGRLYLVGSIHSESPENVSQPIVLHPWPAQWTRQVVVHDRCQHPGTSPDMHLAVAQLLKVLSSWLGNRIESVQIISNGGGLLDAMCADLLRPFKPSASSAASGVRLPQVIPLPFLVHQPSSAVAYSLVLHSSAASQSQALRHMLPSLVRFVSDLQLYGSFDFIFSEWHGWLPSITRLFSNTSLSSLTLHIRLPLKQWTLHQSHQFPIHLSALSSLSLSFDAATALFTQVDHSVKLHAFPSLTHLDLSDQYSASESESGEPARVPYVPFKHMPNLSHFHVHKHQPTSSHVLHVDHVARLAQCAKLVSLRLPAVHHVYVVNWTPPPHHGHQLEVHQEYPVIPRIRALEIGELAPTTEHASHALVPFSWIPSVANATRVVYHCQGDCSLPGMDAPQLDSMYPKLTRLTIHTPAGSVAVAFLAQLAIVAPNLVTLCLHAGSVAIGQVEEGCEQARVPLNLRLLAIHLGDKQGKGEVEGMLGRLELPALCTVRVNVAVRE